MKLWLEKIHLDLKVNWKISRNSTTFKENFVVHLETPDGHYRSEIAPNVRYGETPDSIESQFNEWLKQTEINSLNNAGLLTLALDETPLLHALRFGLESVFIAWFSRGDIRKFLELPELKPVPTSFSMPIIPVNEIEEYLRPLSRFKSLKIKVNAETATDMLGEIHKHTRANLRVDANEGWSDLDAFLKFEASLKGMNIELIEQPFPSRMQDEYRELKKRTSYKLLADESIEDVANFTELSKQFHAVNIKLMKTGSLIKAKKLLLQAKLNGMESMIGCMIETTVGISYGMQFTGMTEYVDLDGFLLIKDEPFKLVSESQGLLHLEW